MSGRPLKIRTPGPSSAEIEKRLWDAGVQPTAQRVAICRYVLCEADHPTADDVKAWADRNCPKLSLATVYNTLNTLVKAGLLRELRFPHSGKTIYDHKLTPHHHFLVEDSGELFDIEPDRVELNLKLPDSFHVKNVDLFLKGELLR